MALSLQESFERSCRLCAEEQEVTIMIFSAEAEAMLLQNKLNKYLLIEVDENDKLPKNICIKCCTKLQTVCDFIDTARKAQEMLLSRSILLDTIMTEECLNTQSKHHIKLEKDTFFEEESQITKMEVNVDPMIVLQNCEGLSSPNEDETLHSNGEDVVYLHGLENENVTIKLIKKGEPTIPLLEPPENKKEDCNGKPFPCHVCKRSFLTELALKNHTWIHNDDRNIKQFTCGSCDESFDYKCDLIIHLKQHRTSGTCNICGRV
ncbi:Myoneurin [Eumeta japonica]|uniref:Myoneurin n=1 Tax=Eumeta variegata TaxID=151549 RepID=A0A4C1UP30_EUMVA|nr:Myoneurin [Eumeta japonica]